VEHRKFWSSGLTGVLDHPGSVEVQDQVEHQEVLDWNIRKCWVQVEHQEVLDQSGTSGSSGSAGSSGLQGAGHQDLAEVQDPWSNRCEGNNAGTR
jgi:hypothetical protein